VRTKAIFALKAESITETRWSVGKMRWQGRSGRERIDARGSPATLPRPERPIDRYLLAPKLPQRGHRVDVLCGGGEAYPLVLEAIRGAQAEILLETYTWKDDATARRFVEAPEERARAGPRLQVLGIGGLRERRRVRRHYDFAIRQVQDTVRISARDFIPDRGWRRASTHRRQGP
jgi:phosphatidylserine/phosphatidylglycerophosphate/cardiolipin synthase-like enzyme